MQEQLTRRPVGRCHTVPSTLTPQMQTGIVSAVRNGRSIAQVAKEYSCDRCVVLEIWLRAELKRLGVWTPGLRGVAA